jgi:precorrin-6x reductase
LDASADASAGFSAARYERQTRGGDVSAENIRAVNEAFRTAMTGDRVFLTAGVDALSSDVKASYPGHLRGVHPRQ